MLYNAYNALSISMTAWSKEKLESINLSGVQSHSDFGVISNGSFCNCKAA